MECVKWAGFTFEEMLLQADVSCYSNEIVLFTKNILQQIKKFDKKVDGYISEGLPKTQEQSTGFKVKYSEVFHYLMDNDNLNPLNYILELVKRGSKDKAMNDENLSLFIGYIARGIRSLTSFIREPDFAAQLKSVLLQLDPEVKAELNHVQDSKDHTDVLLTFKDIQYRIWLYQFSSRGLPHDIDRVTGKRGELLSGIHVLCPLKTELAQKVDTIKRRLSKSNQSISKKTEEMQKCSSRAIKRKENLKGRILSLKGKIADDEAILVKLKDELDIVEGWFFYSKAHINRIAEKLINHRPDEYSEIKEQLEFAEKYLGETNIIKVEGSV